MQQLARQNQPQTGPQADDEDVEMTPLHVEMPYSSETEVDGLRSCVTLEQARIMVWRLAGVPSLGRSGKFVLVREASPGEHLCLPVKALSVEMLVNGKRGLKT